MTRIAFVVALLLTAPWQEAETVEVNDLGPVDLAAFSCQDVTRSSVISRVCYDDARRRMLVQQHTIYHAYCDVPIDMRNGLLDARSMGRFYQINIEAARRQGRYACGA
ncbi:MAG: KTSC domain-containing protein [Bradyrhizobium sp.]